MHDSVYRVSYKSLGYYPLVIYKIWEYKNNRNQFQENGFELSAAIKYVDEDTDDEKGDEIDEQSDYYYDLFIAMLCQLIRSQLARKIKNGTSVVHFLLPLQPY